MLVGDDGSVKVTDFGLVRGSGSGDLADTPRTRGVTETLTGDGGLVGTPAYLAPELFDGDEATERSDQFAVCVALYEALFGRRPFSGDSPGSLLFSIESSEIQPPPRGHGVPSRVLRALTRGLQADPAERHPSVAALVDRLDVAPQGSTVPRVAAVAVAGLALAAGLVAWDHEPAPAVVASNCPAEDEAIHGWSDDRRAALQRAIRDSGTDRESLAVAAAAAADARAAALSRARHQACVASPTVATPRRACIEEQAAALAVTVDVLTGEPVADVLASSVALLSDLPPVELCSDERHLAGTTFMAPGDRTVAMSLWGARTWARAGRVEAAAALAVETLRGVPDDDSSVWVADAKLLMASSAFSRRQFDEAEALVRESVRVARATGDRGREAIALAELISVLATDNRTDAALALQGQALAAAEDGGPEAEWRVQLRLAYALERGGRHGEADASASLAADTLHAFVSPRPRATSEAHEIRARALVASKRLVEACEQYDAALEALVPYGPAHPQRAKVLIAYARALALRGDGADARERFGQAIEILQGDVERNRTLLGNAYLLLADFERTNERLDAAALALRRTTELWGEDPKTEELLARGLIETGIVEFMRGNNEEADAALTAAAEIAARHPGSAEIDLTRLEGMAGGVAVALGDLEAGLMHHKKKLAEEERRFGPSTLVVARSHANIGDIAMYLRRCGEAQASYRRALRIRADLGQPRDDEVVRISAGQTVCDAIEGDIGEARDGVRRLEREIAGGNSAPWRGGRLEMIRAELALREDDVVRARVHAGRARSVYESLGPPHLLDVAHVDRWLAAHPAP